MRLSSCSLTARKSPIGSTNHQWGMKKTPLMEVSLYILALISLVILFIKSNLRLAVVEDMIQEWNQQKN
ncbi:hypothetical protein CN326_03350 [Bacillus sp. AFS018417]|uniref:hypothetical protein n=1 Tax=Bacillus sp. AFS018417 TaxID=2033491 RepID=UPI000BF2C7F7|nr:hypothetical protein [Bacillus sp. AFS018417]PEZ09378.1 hypothetical protein CN326_03350 [Bacillus sp. AFS018417]